MNKLYAQSKGFSIYLFLFLFQKGTLEFRKRRSREITRHKSDNVFLDK